jgi:hypothetical protein
VTITMPKPMREVHFSFPGGEDGYDRACAAANAVIAEANASPALADALDPATIRMEARKVAAEMFYRGVPDAVMQGAYDSFDLVPVAEAAILRGMEMARAAAPPVTSPTNYLPRLMLHIHSIEEYARQDTVSTGLRDEIAKLSEIIDKMAGASA